MARGKVAASVEGFTSEATRTSATTAQYRDRGLSLFFRYRSAMGLTLDDRASPDGLVAWLADQRPSLRPATWRVYRQAILFFLEGWPDADLDHARRVLHEAPGPLSRVPPRTSARKERRILLADYRRLCRYLSRSTATQAARDARDWLIAGLLTGLRPGEWRTTSVVESRGRTWLLAGRLKITNGRGLGSTTSLDISALGEEDRELVGRMADRGRAWHTTATYGQRQEACSQLLRDACHHLWPRKRKAISLSTARHQATAHFKSVLTQEEIAAILGHATTTAAVGYGRRKTAWPVDARPPPPKPPNSLIDVVHRSPKATRPRSVARPSRVAPDVTQGPE